MAFVSWATEYARAKDALANRNFDAFWISSTENSREMRVMYTKLENVVAFIEWLGSKASAEAMSFDEGTIPSCIGGN